MRLALPLNITALFATISFLLIHPVARAGCFTDYLEIVTEPKRELKLVSSKDLPKKIEIITTKKESEKALSIALKAWDQNVDLEKLRGFVHSIAEGNTARVSERVALDELKNSRKFASRLRDNFHLFSIDHEAPEEFNRFVIQFGKLNDSIQAGKLKRAIRMAAKLEDAMDAIPNRETLLYFNPEKRKGFSTFMQESVSELQASATHTEIAVPAFHDARKSVRRLMSYFQISQVLRPNSKNKIILDYLAGLNNKMGKIQNGFVKESLKGRMDYNATTVQFDDAFRQRILAFTDKIRFE